MARAAAQLFNSVTVIAKIGDDFFTSAILTETAKIKADWRFEIATGRGNGMIIVVRDADGERPGGRRILVSSTDAPSHSLSEVEIMRHAELISGSDVLFVDGYSTLSEVSASCLLSAAKIAHEAGSLVCFDLVPHRIDDYLQPDQIWPFVDAADVVIGEARTLARIIGIDANYPFSGDRIEPLAARLTKFHPNVGCWILRYGAGDMQESSMHRPGQEIIHYETDYLNAKVRAGFGDRVAVAELLYLLKARNAAASRDTFRSLIRSSIGLAEERS